MRNRRILQFKREDWVAQIYTSWYKLKNGVK